MSRNTIVVSLVHCRQNERIFFCIGMDGKELGNCKVGDTKLEDVSEGFRNGSRTRHRSDGLWLNTYVLETPCVVELFDGFHCLTKRSDVIRRMENVSLHLRRLSDHQHDGGNDIRKLATPRSPNDVSAAFKILPFVSAPA